ncbi:MAG: CoA pyrophosphatase [archaeon]|nr:MAG: CoA pyrophosphatase [archaeon]
MDRDILAPLKAKLVKDEPKGSGLRFAAVSVIVRDPETPSVLLIKRAEHAADPWSGQVAFPGGKVQEGDRTVKDTAIRETYEEVGIDLAASAEFMGYSGLFRTHNGTMDVVPTAFSLTGDVEVRLNREASSYKWVGLEDLASPKNRSTYTIDSSSGTANLPAVVVDDYVVWGLTHRILTSLLGLGPP